MALKSFKSRRVRLSPRGRRRAAGFVPRCAADHLEDCSALSSRDTSLYFAPSIWVLDLENSRFTSYGKSISEIELKTYYLLSLEHRPWLKHLHMHLMGMSVYWQGKIFLHLIRLHSERCAMHSSVVWVIHLTFKAYTLHEGYSNRFYLQNVVTSHCMSMLKQHPTPGIV